jgi:lycopene cyclase domain-containing protein
MFVLLGCILGSGWLEFLLRTRVYRRTFRLILSVFPVVIVYVLWDAYAIAQGHWTFDSRFITNIKIVLNVPLDEVAFFVVIPICAILTLEGVRSSRPHWLIGDEQE